MPIHEYRCAGCNITFEDITTKVSDVVDWMECPLCFGKAGILLSRSHIRMRKLFTAGGPNIEDKDGFESLGMSGEEAQESEKKHHDHTQKVEKEGKDPFIAAVEMSPSREMTDEEVYIAGHEREIARNRPIPVGEPSE